MASDDRLYFRQLLSGRDFAVGDPIAAQMRNFAYLIGDRETGHAVLVDPAYAAGDLLDTLESDGMKLSGVLVTHHHPDHIGGSMMGFELRAWPSYLNGLACRCTSIPEAQWVSRVTGIPMSDLTTHVHGDKVAIGDIDIELLHTPATLRGSQCFLLDGRLVAGDTLFLEGCGRTDFPGGDVDEVFRSLQQRRRRGDPTVFGAGTRLTPAPACRRSSAATMSTESLEPGAVALADGRLNPSQRRRRRSRLKPKMTNTDALDGVTMV